MLAEGCVSNQTSVVFIIVVWFLLSRRAYSVHVRGHHYRGLGRGLPLTLPNVRQVNGRDQRLRPDLDRGALPGQQAVVHQRLSQSRIFP